MRTGKRMIGMVALVAAGGGAVASASLPTPGRQVNCGFVVKSHWEGNRRGHDHATLVCGKPLGRGVEHDRYTAKTTAKKATLTDHVTESFAGGTLRARLDARRGFVSPGPPSIATWQYTGGGHITGGTGAYKHAKGIAALICFSRDQGVHMSCQITLKLTSL
jgi:hypothetical protein